jgi:hypothetical protein
VTPPRVAGRANVPPAGHASPAADTCLMYVKGRTVLVDVTGRTVRSACQRPGRSPVDARSFFHSYSRQPTARDHGFIHD